MAKLKVNAKRNTAPTGPMAHFPPGRSPRGVQQEMIEKIAAAFESGKRFVVLEGPPGVGKSMIAVTLARYMRGAYICTLTKQLQAQYVGEFEALGARELKGRNAFPCSRAGRGRDATCELGGMLFTGKDACGLEGSGCACPYKVAKADALEAPMTVCNYYSYLYNVGEGGEVEDWIRPLLILDEGHEIEKVLMAYVSIDINENTLPVAMPKPAPRSSDVNDYWAWLELLLGVIKGKGKHPDPAEQTKTERFVRRVKFALACRDREEWIAEPWEKGSGFSLKPLTVASFGDMLFKYGQQVLVMSATILDAKKLAESTGIPVEDMEFISAPCIFPVENRPVYVGKLPMTKAYRDQSWPVMVQAIVNILEHHKDEKGLILAPSNELLKFLMKELPQVNRAHANRVLYAFGQDRMEKYQLHVDAKIPTVLAASGFWEGADLKDDLSRFQIIPALPRAMWSGQIAARGKLDPTWYRWRCMTQFVQGVGRSVRNETDHAVTYVLDIALREELNRRNSMIPPWLREAVTLLDD